MHALSCLAGLGFYNKNMECKGTIDVDFITNI